MDWTGWDTGGWPDWSDIGKRVEIEREDGTIVAGELIVDDFFPDGEGGEVPVFAILVDDDTQHSFVDQKHWRFAEV